MAEKKRVDLVKIEVYDEDDWFHVDISAKTEEMGKMVKDLLSGLGGLIPGFPGGGKGKIQISSKDLLAFATQLPLEQLEHLVSALSKILERRKQKAPPGP